MKAKRVMDTEGEGKRITYFIWIMVLLFFILIARLFQLQIINGDEYREKAVRNSLRQNVVKAARGKIYDVNGEILADNTTGYKIIHLHTKTMSSNEKEILLELHKENKIKYDLLSDNSKKKIDEMFFDINYISKISEIDFEEIVDVFYKTPTSGYDKEIVVVEDISQEVALKESEKLPNERIDIVEYNKRSYPKEKLASHTIGYVKLIDPNEYKELKDEGYLIDDLIGKKGIEKKYDKVLKGENGIEYVEVDVRGNLKKKLDEDVAIGGTNIYLSIDVEFQKYMTELFGGRPGAFIAMNVKTGKILTMLSSPEIDLNILGSKISQKQWNNFINSKSTPLVNKAITGLYPPGSTFKVVSGAAILESGIDPNKAINSTGEFTYGKVTFKDSHLAGHGLTNFYKSIEESVNTYYYENILKINRDKFFDIAKDFGIGEKTGIDIYGEQEGLLPTPEWKKSRFKKRSSQVWLPGDLINMSIGQGYLLVTPIQILSIYQAIANNGVVLEPTLVDRFVDSKGEEILNKANVSRTLKISPRTLNDIKKALRLPVKGNRGTARMLNFPYVEVSAKTGTAQNSSANNHSWMAGYFPSNDPEIAFVVLVEQGGYGSVAAGPIARAFIEKYYEKKGVIELNNGEK